MVIWMRFFVTNPSKNTLVGSQLVDATVVPFEIHPVMTALRLDGKLREEDREGKGRGVKAVAVDV